MSDAHPETLSVDPNFKQPREECQHPDLVQMGQDVCDPDLVTVCTRCGLAWPGVLAQDLRAA